MKKLILLSLFALLSACSIDFKDENRDALYDNNDEAICSEAPDRCLEEGITW